MPAGASHGQRCVAVVQGSAPTAPESSRFGPTCLSHSCLHKPGWEHWRRRMGGLEAGRQAGLPLLPCQGTPLCHLANIRSVRTSIIWAGTPASASTSWLRSMRRFVVGSFCILTKATGGHVAYCRQRGRSQAAEHAADRAQHASIPQHRAAEPWHCAAEACACWPAHAHSVGLCPGRTAKAAPSAEGTIPEASWFPAGASLETLHQLSGGH